MIRDEGPAQAIIIKEAVASHKTCSPTTVSQLKAYLSLGKSAESDGANSHAPALCATSSRAPKPSRNVRVRAPKQPKAIHETRAAQVTQATPADQAKLATEVINATLKAFNEAVKAQSTMRLPCDANGPVGSTNPSALDQSRSPAMRLCTNTPLQPLSVNVVCSDQGFGKDSRRSSQRSTGSTGIRGPSGYTAQAECVRLAFSALKSLDARGVLGGKLPFLQIEDAMSTLVHKLVALRLFDSAHRQLRAMRKSLLSLSGQNDKADIAFPENGTGKEKLSDLLIIPCIGASGSLLSVIVAFQLHVLRLIATKRNPAHFKATLDSLRTDNPCSPAKLIQRQLNGADPGSRAKVISQLEALSRLVLSLCPNISSSEDEVSSHSKVMDPLVAFRFQLLALEYRHLWWATAGHKGDVAKDLLIPFSQYLSTFRRQCKTAYEEGYRAAKEVFASFPFRAQDGAHLSSAAAASNEVCFSIYSELITLSQRSRLSDESKDWLQKIQKISIDDGASPCKRCTSTCKKAVLHLQALDTDSSEDQVLILLREADQLIHEDLEGGSDELDELLLVITGLRKAAGTIINKSLKTRNHAETSPSFELTQECYSVCLTCVKFLSRYIGTRPPSSPDSRVSCRYEKRLERGMAVLAAFVDSVIAISRIAKECDPQFWHKVDSGLQVCLHLAIISREASPGGPTEDVNGTISVFGLVSSAYWSRYLYLKQTDGATKDILKTLDASINAVERSPFACKEAAQLQTKFELLGNALEIARDYLRSVAVYIKAIRLYTEMGVLQKAAALAGSLSVSALLSQQKEFVPLGRVLSAYARLALKIKAETPARIWPYEDDTLEVSERGVILEHLLSSLIKQVGRSESISQAIRAIQGLAADLLALYSRQMFPIRRRRVVEMLIWFQSSRPDILLPEFIDTSTEPSNDSSASKLDGPDEGLKPLLCHLDASQDAVLAMQEACLVQKQVKMKKVLAVWHSLVAQSHNLEALQTRVGDTTAWLFRLQLLVEYLGGYGLGLHRRSTLQVLVNVRTRFFPAQQDELALNLTQLGLQHLWLGYPHEAGLTFQKVHQLAINASLSNEAMVSFNTAYAEYLLDIGSIDRCEENLLQAQKISESNGMMTGGQHPRVEQLLGDVILLRSEVAAQRGDQCKALLLARQSLMSAHQAWTKSEKRQRKARADEQCDDGTSDVDGLVETMSGVTVTDLRHVQKEPAISRPRSANWALVPRLHRALLQVSRLYSRAGMHHEAQYYLERSLRFATDTSAKVLAVTSLGLLADILARSGRFEEAESKFEDASKQYKILEGDPSVIDFHLSFANYCMAKGQNSAAGNICTAVEEILQPGAGSDPVHRIPNMKLELDAVQGQLSQLDIGTDDQGPPDVKSRGTKNPVKRCRATAKAGRQDSSDAEPPSIPMRKARSHYSQHRVMLAIQQGKLDVARALLVDFAKHHCTPEDTVFHAMLKAEVHVARGLESLNGDPVFCVLAESATSCPSVISGRPTETAASPKARIARIGRKPGLRSTGATDNKRTRAAAAVSTVTPPSIDFLEARIEMSSVVQLAKSVCSTATLHRLSKNMMGVLPKISALNLPDCQRGVKATPSALLAIADLARSVSVFRAQTAIQVDKALPSRDKLLTWPDPNVEDGKCQSRPDEFSSSIAAHEHCLDTIPNTWQVLSLSLSHAKGEILVSRIRSGQGPFILSLPLNRHNSRDPDEDNFSYSQAKTELQDIIRLADFSTHNLQDTSRKGSNAAWWEGRAVLDARLKDLLNNMENMWFGGFQGVFSQQLPARQMLSRFHESLCALLDNHLPSRQGLSKRPRSEQVTLDPRVVELFVALGDPALFSDMEEPLMDLLYFVVDILQFNGERNAYDEIDFDSMTIEVFDALRQYHEAAKKAHNTSAIEHTILVLDKELHCFPWESLPCLDGQAVTRLPSLSCLRDRLLQQQQKNEKDGITNDRQSFCVERRSGAFVLNPAGDLKATQTKFEQPLAGLVGWESVTEGRPSEEQLVGYLQERDIFLYFGHGSGSQYIRSGTIRKLDKCAVAVLMGCSSGKLTEAGEFEPCGTPMSYMQAGCPAMVATLWDVTDKDIDRFSETMLQRWGLFKSQPPLESSPAKKSARAKGKGKAPRSPSPQDESRSLDQAVAQARGSCIFRYLNGAAPVVYGIPVFLS